MSKEMVHNPIPNAAGSKRLSPTGPKLRSIHDELTHYPQTSLRWVGDMGWMSNSQVLLTALADPTRAILFIHGWNGGAGSTWESFPEFACTMPELSAADVFFLEYPTLQSQVPFCAARVRNFFTDLVGSPADRIINPSLPSSASQRSPTFAYQKIIVVAHSMGAVVARRAILDLDQSSPAGFTNGELEKFKLLFFAPAHSGSAIPLLIGAGLGLDFLPGAKFLGTLARDWFQSLRDLEEGSPFLRKLADDCKRIREGRTEHNAPIGHIRAIVYHAQHDRVVSQNDFDNDPPFQPVMNKGHRTICKPNKAYLNPVEAFRAILSE
jgi:pimeloyl-ACP methyl ester carboxylesterase